MFDTELVLIEDAAAELGVRPSTLREWCRNGTFPCVKHAGKRRVWLRADWIRLWLAGSDLEVTQLPGGTVVRPTGTRSTPEERIGGVVNV